MRKAEHAWDCSVSFLFFVCFWSTVLLAWDRKILKEKKGVFRRDRPEMWLFVVVFFVVILLIIIIISFLSGF
jgi:hypothetical protein